MRTLFNPNRDKLFDRLQEDFAIILPGAVAEQRPEWGRRLDVAMDSARRDLGIDPRTFGFDAAQPLAVTQSNAGIPQFLTTVIDPKFIEVYTAPLNATKIAKEELKGDWTKMTWEFPIVEATGMVASYDDYSTAGEANFQVNWVPRQSYLFQTQTEWGELELERAGLAKIDAANRKNLASAKVMAEFMNTMYFYGFSGLQNYGLLNDPNLPAAISPLQVSSNYLWSLKDALGVYGDIQLMVQTLINQTSGMVTMESAMKLAMSPSLSVNLTKVTQYNVSVADMLKKNFPHLEVVTAVQYATASGNLLQLIADELNGDEVVTTAFNLKVRAHAVVRDSSSFKQKKSGGGWGAIWYQPTGVVQMLGA